MKKLTLLLVSLLTINAYAANETTFAINRDKRISVRRDKVEGLPMHQIVGQKWIATRHWKYSIRNNSSTPIVLELSDRTPVPNNKEISVNCISDTQPKYHRDGIITWKIVLEPSESKQLDLKYTVSCPKDRTLSID